MFKIVLFFAGLLFADAAVAQTVTCPTRPTTDNSNACASTAFVKNVLAGAPVTSVGLAAPSSLFAVTGSPVTSSGTLTLSFQNQTANRIFAGPSSGGAAAPTFRSLVTGDLPDYSQGGSGSLSYSYQNRLRNEIWISDYCSLSSPPANYATCINSALSAAAAAGGGIVRMPCGTFPTTSAITFTASFVHLVGSGKCTSIVPTCSCTTIDIHSSATTTVGAWYGNAIRNLYIVETSKTGGYTVNAAGIAQFLMEDIWIDNPFAGPRIHDFNDIVLQRIRIVGLTGSGQAQLLLSGGGTLEGANGRSDVVDLIDVVLGMDVGSRTGNYHGLVVDGFVSTVSAHKLYLVAIDGYGLWFRNTLGASANPQFAAFYGLESDYNYYAAIYAQAASVLNFTDPQIHGTASGPNILLANGVKRVTLKGGFSTGAATQGISSDGDFINITGMQILDNSASSHTTYPGIEIGGNSNGVTIMGNTIGGENVGWQSYQIVINTGADNWTIGPNTAYNNNNNAVNNGAGTSASKVLITGAQ